MGRAKKVEPKKKTIPFRPGSRLRELLEAEKDSSGAPFQKIIEKALDEYLRKRGA